jgi:hypothetical protein
MTGRSASTDSFFWTEIPLGQTERKCLSVAAASRAGLAVFLDRHGSATTLTVPVTQTLPNSIMVTIESIIVTNAITVAPAFTDSDSVRTHGHFGLGQRDRIVRNSGGACEGGQCCQA